MDFTETTQYKNWTFTKKELLELRRTAHNNARKRFQAFEQHFVTFEQEEQLCLYYAAVAGPSHAKKYNFTSKVMGTALIYFRRFYLFNSIMEFHPKDMILTCMYMASKTEEYNIAIEEFLKYLSGNITEDKILTNELKLLESLQFQLIVYHPFKSLQGLLTDFKDNNPSIPVESISKILEKGNDLIQLSLATDLIFQFTPSQIALAIFTKLAAEFNLSSALNVYICSICNKEQQVQFLDICAAILRELSPINTKELHDKAKLADSCIRKLKADIDKNSPAIQRPEDKEKEEKRQQKLKERTERDQQQIAAVTGVPLPPADGNPDVTK